MLWIWRQAKNDTKSLGVLRTTLLQRVAFICRIIRTPNFVQPSHKTGSEPEPVGGSVRCQTVLDCISHDHLPPVPLLNKAATFYFLVRNNRRRGGDHLEQSRLHHCPGTICVHVHSSRTGRMEYRPMVLSPLR